MFVVSNSYVYFSKYCSDGRARVSLGIIYKSKQQFDENLLKISQQLLLNRIKDKAIQYEESCSRLQEPLKKLVLESIVREILGKGKGKDTFLSDWETMITKMKSGELVQKKTGKRYSENTIVGYGTTLKQLTRFTEKEKIVLNYKFNIDTRNQFVQWMMRQDYATNTISISVSLIKLFLGYAKSIGRHNNLFHKDDEFLFSPELTDTIALSMQEIKTLYELKLTAAQGRARDVFVFGCFLALRKSDLIQINNYVIRGNVIEVLTTKTGEKVILPLHPYVREIHEKYGGQLPVFHYAMLNYHLPRICKIAGFKDKHLITMTKGGVKKGQYYEKWELVSPHTIRRTCATNMYLAGIPVHDCMKITGHKTEEMFLRYIRIAKEENAQRLALHPFFTDRL